MHVKVTVIERNDSEQAIAAVTGNVKGETTQKMGENKYEYEVGQETGKIACRETAEPSATVSECNLASRKHMWLHIFICSDVGNADTSAHKSRLYATCDRQQAAAHNSFICNAQMHIYYLLTYICISIFVYCTGATTHHLPIQPPLSFKPLLYILQPFPFYTLFQVTPMLHYSH